MLYFLSDFYIIDVFSHIKIYLKKLAYGHDIQKLRWLWKCDIFFIKSRRCGTLPQCCVNFVYLFLTFSWNENYMTKTNTLTCRIILKETKLYHGSIFWKKLWHHMYYKRSCNVWDRKDKTILQKKRGCLFLEFFLIWLHILNKGLLTISPK